VINIWILTWRRAIDTVIIRLSLKMSVQEVKQVRPSSFANSLLHCLSMNAFGESSHLL